MEKFTARKMLKSRGANYNEQNTHDMSLIEMELFAEEYAETKERIKAGLLQSDGSKHKAVDEWMIKVNRKKSEAPNILMRIAQERTLLQEQINISLKEQKKMQTRRDILDQTARKIRDKIEKIEPIIIIEKGSDLVAILDGGEITLKQVLYCSPEQKNKTAF